MSKIISVCIVVLVGAVILFQFLSDEPKSPQIKTLADTKAEEQKKDTSLSEAPTETALEEKTIEQTASEEVPEETIDSEKIETAPPAGMASSQQKEEILSFLDSWKKAWQNSARINGDIDSYISFYSDTFKSAGFDKSGWKDSKGSKNQKKDWIEVWMSNIEIKALPDENTFQASFKQEYSSSNYSDISSKTLTLEKLNGEWLILAEQ